jgi:hypothetical protein
MESISATKESSASGVELEMQHCSTNSDQLGRILGARGESLLVGKSSGSPYR